MVKSQWTLESEIIGSNNLYQTVILKKFFNFSEDLKECSVETCSVFLTLYTDDGPSTGLWTHLGLCP
jgi:hypothetical protein